MASVQPVRAKMIQIRKVCEADISTYQTKFDASFSFFHNSLLSLRSHSQLSSNNQVKLGKLKVELRDLEDELVRALSVKIRKEAKRMAVAESLSETRTKVDELQKIVRDQAARKDEYAAILSQQSSTLVECEEKSRQAVKHREEIQQACEWYNRVLGFRIEGGHGVKFSFTYINRKSLANEYSFTIRHANNVYTLIESNPQFNDTVELVRELNKSNGLYKFVRIMRDKFVVTASGPMSEFIDQDQDSTSMSLSAPVSSVSIGSRSRSPLPLHEANRDFTHASSRKGLNLSVLSPTSASSHRRSPRLLEKIGYNCVGKLMYPPYKRVPGGNPQLRRG